MKNRLKLINGTQSWDASRRYKINSVVSLDGVIYQNTTGLNTDPTLGVDWTTMDLDLSSYETKLNKVSDIEDSDTTYPSSSVVYKVDERLQAVEGVTSVENGKIPNSKITSQYGNLGELVNQNLASTTTYTSGYFINWLTGVSTVNAIYSHTGYMAVKAGEKYRWYQKDTEPNDDGNAIGALYGAYYNESGVFISGINITTTDTVITVPSGAASVRVTYSNSENAGNFYFYKVLQYTSYGDSITAQNTWQPLLSEYLSLYHTVDGYGGARIAGSDTSALNQDTRLLTISSTADIITVMGGTNDWAASIELGEETSTDVETFFGALNSLFYKLKTNYPNALIIALATPYGEYPNREYFDDKVGILNNEGLSTVDYGNAMIVAAKNNHIRFVATHKLWDTDNIANFITYDGAYLHPNTLGGVELASKISLDIIQDVLKLRTETKEVLANKVSVITTPSTTNYPNVTAVRTVAGGVTLNTIPRSSADGTLKDSGLVDDGTNIVTTRNFSAGTTKIVASGTTGVLDFIMSVRKKVYADANNSAVGMLFSLESSADYGKGGIAFERTGGYGFGTIHFLNNSTSGTSNPTLADSRLKIKATSIEATVPITGTTFNGVALTSANPETTFLNGAGAYTNPVANIVSGYFTPTGTGLYGATFLKSYYTKNGTILTMHINLSLTPTSASSTSTGSITLPNSYAVANSFSGRVVGSGGLSSGSNTNSAVIIAKEGTTSTSLDLYVGNSSFSTATTYYCSLIICVEIS